MIKRFYIQISFFLFFCISQVANAGTIEIHSSSTITIEKKNGFYAFFGTYTLNNKGSEGAFNVYPELGFASWTWKGQKRDILKNTKETWSIDERIDFKDLECRELCAKLNLPIKGVLPVKAIVSYKSNSGYTFSTSEIINLPFALGGGMRAKIAKEPSVLLALDKEEDGNKFKVNINGKSLNHSIKYVFIRFLTSKELKVLSPPIIAELDNDGQFSYSADIKNLSGTTGSAYKFNVILEWSESLRPSSKDLNDYFRATRTESIRLEIHKKNPIYSYLLGIAGLFFFGAIAIYCFVYID